MNLQKGQEIYLNRYSGKLDTYTVTRVGRKYAYLSNGEKVIIDGDRITVVKGTRRIRTDTFYTSLEEAQEVATRNTRLRDVKRKLGIWSESRVDVLLAMTSEDLEQFQKILSRYS